MHLSFAVFLTVLSVSSVLEAKTFARREVPQEHSHEALLTAMRAIVPAGTPSVQGDGNLPDVVFGLLGNQVAGTASPTKGDAGAICLQQDLADTAISLASGDSKKIATAFKYRALERNTGAVGAKSDLCTKKPKNVILEGLTQHQDPASQGAAAFNKNVEITLAKKLASLGQDPLGALETATFAPGKIGDPTAKGLSCDDANDKAGCIFTQKLNVPAASKEEIQAAVGGGGAAKVAAVREATTANIVGHVAAKPVKAAAKAAGAKHVNHTAKGAAKHVGKRATAKQTVEAVTPPNSADTADVVAVKAKAADKAAAEDKAKAADEAGAEIRAKAADKAGAEDKARAADEAVAVIKAKAADKAGAEDKARAADEAVAEIKAKAADKAGAEDKARATDEAGAEIRAKAADKAGAEVNAKAGDKAGADKAIIEVNAKAEDKAVAAEAGDAGKSDAAAIIESMKAELEKLKALCNV